MTLSNANTFSIWNLTNQWTANLLPHCTRPSRIIGANWWQTAEINCRNSQTNQLLDLYLYEIKSNWIGIKWQISWQRYQWVSCWIMSNCETISSSGMWRAQVSTLTHVFFAENQHCERRIRFGKRSHSLLWRNAMGVTSCTILSLKGRGVRYAKY